MGNLNEQVNKRVVFENDDYGVYLPYNLLSICTLVPDWCKTEEGKNNVLSGFKQKGVTYLVNNKKNKDWFILQDEGSSIPLQKSGLYKMYTPNASGIRAFPFPNTKKYFSKSSEVIKALNLKYSTTEMIKYGVPFSPEEQFEYSEVNSFAKTIYNIMMGETFIRTNTSILEKFTGRDDIEIIDEPLAYWTDVANGAVAVHPTEEGVTFYMEEGYYREKFLNIGDDDDWAYSLAMGYGGDNCEEMDYDEMNYMGNYLNQENRGELNKIRVEMGYEQITDFSRDEGEITDFLEEHFPEEATRLVEDWLYTLGCAIGRGRVKGVKEFIDDEILFEYEEKGNNVEMFISWSSLLRVVGKNNIENFYGIVDMELNDIGGIHDTYYDNWEVDDEGDRELNQDFTNMISKIKDEYLGDLKDIKKNAEEFKKKVIEPFGFVPSNRWSSHSSFKLKTPIQHPHGPLKSDGTGGEAKMIHIEKFNPLDNEITFYDKGYGYQNSKNEITKNVDEFIDYLNNLKNNPEIPFPKETNENYTNRIINNIINNVIIENVHKQNKKHIKSN